jgi:hypothetical protein
LDFLFEKFESESALKDLVGTMKPWVGAGEKEYTMHDLIDEIRHGTKMGQRLYTSLYPLYEKEFKDYLGKDN